MSDSQKTHTQTRTAQHTSVAGNTHSPKGISMPAVPVLQQMKEEPEEQKQAADKSYSPHRQASGEGDKPGTKSATAFAQKKSSLPPAQTIQRFELRDKSPARETNNGIAQFKSDNPVQRQGKLYQNSTSVNLREIPGGPVTNTIPVGTIMEGMDETQTPGGVWVQVKAPGSTGWVNKDSVTAI